MAIQALAAADAVSGTLDIAGNLGAIGYGLAAIGPGVGHQARPSRGCTPSTWK